MVVPITNDAGRNTGGEHALETLAAGTGGRPFYPSVGAELDQAFADILRDLRTQYMMGYYPHGVATGDAKFQRFAWRFPGARICASRRALAIMEGSRAKATLAVAGKVSQAKAPDQTFQEVATCGI